MKKRDRYQHLVEACGEDPHQLAELALLMSMAAFGMGVSGKKDAETLDMVLSLNAGVAEIQRRMPGSGA